MIARKSSRFKIMVSSKWVRIENNRMFIDTRLLLKVRADLSNFICLVI